MSLPSQADILAAAGDAAALQRVLRSLTDTFGRIQDQGGFNLTGGDPTQTLTSPPSPPSWSVQGIDSQFIVRITAPQAGVNQQATTANPNPPGDPTSKRALPMTPAPDNVPIVNILYQFQSSLTSDFGDAGQVITYPAEGASAELAYDIAGVENEIRYWRIRARFPGSDFGPWYNLLGPSGAQAVDSSFVRSTTIAPRSPQNVTNTGTFDSIDAGASDTIRGYDTVGGIGTSITVFDGQGGSRAIGSMTILGAARSTDFALTWSVKNLFQAFPIVTQYLNSIKDALYYLATLHTVAAGGGGGVSGGGGGDGSGIARPPGAGGRTPDL